VRLVTLAALLAISIGGSCAASDSSKFEIYVVKLSSVELSEKKVAIDPSPAPTDLNEVVIDNGCGAFHAKFEVLATVRGSHRGSISVEGGIGEWCRLPFSASLLPQVLWVLPEGRWSHLQLAMPAHEVRPSQYAIVPDTEVPCVEVKSKDAWTLMPEPIYLGGSATLSSITIDYLRNVDALLEKDEDFYAQRAVILTTSSAAGCSNNRWSGR